MVVLGWSRKPFCAVLFLLVTNLSCLESKFQPAYTQATWSKSGERSCVAFRSDTPSFGAFGGEEASGC